MCVFHPTCAGRHAVNTPCGVAERISSGGGHTVGSHTVYKLCKHDGRVPSSPTLAQPVFLGFFPHGLPASFPGASAQSHLYVSSEVGGWGGGFLGGGINSAEFRPVSIKSWTSARPQQQDSRNHVDHLSISLAVLEAGGGGVVSGFRTHRSTHEASCLGFASINLRRFSFLWIWYHIYRLRG